VQPLISVVMPVFNGELHLTTAIDSILSQTLGDFEFIIINDGSKDGSAEILSKYESRDKRIKLISRENKGLQVSLNEGIELATGKYIARMDCDDISLPSRFQKQLFHLEKYGGDICGSWVRLFGDGIDFVNTYPYSFDANNIQLLFGTCFAHPSIFTRAELIKSLKYSENESCKAEDYDLWTRCSQAGAKLTNVQEVLLLYRQHENQLTKLNSDSIIKSKQIIQKKHWAFVGCGIGLIDYETMRLSNFISCDLDGSERDSIESLLFRVIEMTNGESRYILLKNLTNFYCKNASILNNPVQRWIELNNFAGYSINYKYLIILFIASLLSPSQNASLYTLYNKLMRR
jgi:glycosyltransferase involved in cell wall biosynthesis